MRGKHRIIVQNNKLRYEIVVRRNITIIRGDSGTGKSVLVNLIRTALIEGDESSVVLRCDKPIRILQGPDWLKDLSSMEDTIIFIDEGSRFVRSQEFAQAVKSSDNYYVLITRDDLQNLPYSVEEIYGIHSSGKYHDLKHTYNTTFPIRCTILLIFRRSPSLFWLRFRQQVECCKDLLLRRIHFDQSPLIVKFPPFV